MAVINTYALISPSTKISPSVGYSPQLSAFSAVDNSPPVQPYEYSHAGFVDVISNLPIAQVNQTLTCYKAPSFLDDYYYRVHINPSILSLGNLLSTQSRTVGVWNANFESRNLSSILAVGDTDGLILSGISAPKLFAQLELSTFNISISTTGSPVIDATYRFIFEVEEPELRVTGRRVVTIPYKPKYNIDETLTWFTDIIQSKGLEKRIALRDAPRQRLKFEVDLSPTEFSLIKAVANQWTQRVFGIPVWSEAVKVGNLNVGITSISMDTTKGDFRSNDIIQIYSPVSGSLSVETLTVSSDSIELKLPLQGSFFNAEVIPLRFARANNGITMSRNNDARFIGKFDFTVTANASLPNDSAFSKYKTRPVLLDARVVDGSVNEYIIREVDKFDNLSGAINIEERFEFSKVTVNVTLFAFTKQALWDYRRLLHSLYGRQKTVFVPSKHADVEITKDLSSTAAAIEVNSISFGQYYNKRYILIELKNGFKHFNKVTSSNISNDGLYEVLNLETLLGFNATVSEIKRVSFMLLCRLDTDEINISHKVGDQFAISFSVKEVPDDL